MSARKRKKFYLKRGGDGKEYCFSRPGEFLLKAYEYFDWCDNNPLLRNELIRAGSKTGEIIKIEVDRLYSLTGLCNFTGISEDTFYSYSSKNGYRDITSHLLEIIRQSQLEGALMGNYNLNVLSYYTGETNKPEERTECPITIQVLSEETKYNLEKLKDDIKRKEAGQL